MDHEKVLDKIHKLHAHAESAAAIGNEQEAQAFAAVVARLLTEHKLSMSEVEVAREDLVNPVGLKWVDLAKYGILEKQQRQGWSESLANMIAHAHHCRLVVRSRSSSVGFVGRTEDVAVVEYLFVVLYKSALRLADLEYAAAWREAELDGDVTRCRGFKASFLLGFLRRLSERFYSESERVKQENRGAPGLLRLDQDQATLAAYMKGFSSVAPTSVRRGELNYDGVVRGKRCADEVSTRANAVRGGQARGQAQLPGRRA